MARTKRTARLCAFDTNKTLANSAIADKPVGPTEGQIDNMPITRSPLSTFVAVKSNTTKETNKLNIRNQVGRMDCTF